eukprot:scaffold45194_cov37-Phaeocystis_antarctica.AAC.1
MHEFDCCRVSSRAAVCCAWPGFSRPLRLSTPVLEHMHKCRGGIAHARATTPSFIFDAPPWVGCLLMMMPRPARRS